MVGESNSRPGIVTVFVRRIYEYKTMKEAGGMQEYLVEVVRGRRIRCNVGK